MIIAKLALVQNGRHSHASHAISTNQFNSKFQLTSCFNPRIALRGKKKSPQLSFWISEKFLFSIGCCPFMTFSWIGSGYKMRQSGRQMVQQKFIGMTSNTVIFLNWRNFMVMLTNMTKQIQNKYCCNSSNKILTFRQQQHQRKCLQMIATTTDNEPEIAIWPPKPEILISLELW